MLAIGSGKLLWIKALLRHLITSTSKQSSVPSPNINCCGFLGHRLKLLKCCGACATITVFVKRAKAFNLTLFCVACFAFSNCIAYCVFPSIAQSNRVINLSILRREFYTAVACVALLWKNCVQLFICPLVSRWTHSLPPDEVTDLTYRFAFVRHVLLFLELQHSRRLVEDDLQ